MGRGQLVQERAHVRLHVARASVPVVPRRPWLRQRGLEAHVRVGRSGGAQLVGVQMMGVDSGSFWSQMQSAVELRYISEGLVKSALFGIACSLIAVHQGYYAEPTAEGVGLATTRTVVISAVVVLFLDYLVTSAFL